MDKISWKHIFLQVVKEVNENFKKPFACYVCGAGFVMERNVKRHISTVHEQRRLFQCAICNKGKF